MSLTPRENLERVVAFDSPEYVPTGVSAHILRYVGTGHEALDGSGGDGSPANVPWTDVWGVGWRKELPDVMGLTEHCPLADITKVDSYAFPDPSDPRICGRIHDDKPEIDPDCCYLAGMHRDTLFEQAYMLVGMEDLFVAFLTEPEAVRTLLHKITDFHLGLAEQYVARGVEWAFVGDDLGHQRGLLFSPEVLWEFFVPEYRRLFSYYASHGVRLDFHSCGQVHEALDAFMDLGITVLNPIQATANDLAQVRERTMGRMTLQGGVPSHVVMDGPIERIREETQAAIRLLGANGGYLCCPDQHLPFPEEHMQALIDAVSEFGRYPVG